jgi:anti-sigma factor RsiW
MNCPRARDLLPALLYGDLEPDVATEVNRHCVECPGCRTAFEQLRRLEGALDAVPVPAVQVNLAKILEQAAQQQGRKLRTWRRLGHAGIAAAAVLLLGLGLKLEVRIQADQLIVRWHAVPEVVEVSPSATHPASPGVSEEDMHLVKELIHALATEVERRDQRQQQMVADLQARLQALQWGANERCTATERNLAALYFALRPRDQGEKR